MTLRLDIIGDLHGQLAPLLHLAPHLGYDIDPNYGKGDWSHPERRVLVFLGDLVDRGPHSLEVAELVMDLVRRGRAICLMGNHEYNLVAWRKLGRAPKKSNLSTITDIEERPERWAPVLEFFATLPLAIELPDLRIIHASWHHLAFDAVEPMLGRPTPQLDAEGLDPIYVLEEHIRLVSPFDQGTLVEGLPAEPLLPPAGDLPHEILVKGFEAAAEQPFPDNEGVLRDAYRVPWWLDEHTESTSWVGEGGPWHAAEGTVPRDKRTVFGHYWNVPPTLAGAHPWRGFAPPAPSGTPQLRTWIDAMADAFPRREMIAEVSVPEDTWAICVDYNSVAKGRGGGCVGAYRYPDHRIVWARTP